MHNIKTNFDKFYQIVKSSFPAQLNEDDNLQFYPNKPKMNDCSIIALSICAESIGIDSENYLWSKIRKITKTIFPNWLTEAILIKGEEGYIFYTWSNQVSGWTS